MALQGLIFDLDGTLLDTLKDLADCHNRVLQLHGYPTHPVAAYRYFIGNGARTCIERSLPENARDPTIIDACLASQKVDYASNWHITTTEYAGMTKLLEKLGNNGLALAVLSNKDQAFTTSCIKHFFPGIGFCTVQGYEPGIAHKPNPVGALQIADSMHLQTNEIALVGDTAIDMQTAINAGMHPIGALWGFRDRRELIEAGAKTLLTEPADLLAVL